MTQTTRIKLFPFGVIIPFFLLALLAYLASTISFPRPNNILSIGITADLILTTPLIYFLIIRKTKIPNVTVVPVFILGIIIGSYFLPKEQQGFLILVKTWFLPLVELAVISLIFLKLKKLRQSMKNEAQVGADFYSTLKSASSEIFPKRISIFFATELAVFYYAIIKWKTPELKENEFTAYKETGTRAILYALVGIVLIETTIGHILIMKVSHIGAWVLTILSIYTGLQVLGFVKSLSHRPIRIENDLLKLRYGLFAETEIQIENIESLERLSWKAEIDDNVTRLSPLGEMDSYNLIIRLKREQEMTGFYGKRKSYNSLAVHIDELEKFLSKLSIQRQT